VSGNAFLEFIDRKTNVPEFVMYEMQIELLQ